MSKVVIIGNGVSGVTAARHIRKLDSAVEIMIISSESDYHYSRTALMYIYMGHMRQKDTQPYETGFWVKNRIELKRGYVAEVNTDEKKLKLEGGDELKYDKLILATGSKSNKLGWLGQDLKGVQGLYNLQDLEVMETTTKDAKQAVIVGGGLIGVEMAEMLLSRGIGVTFLVREDRFWGNVLPREEAHLIQRHLSEHFVRLNLETNLTEILSDEQGRVKAVKTDKGEIIECQFVGLTVGVSPNIDFLKPSKIELDKGILVNEYFETNIENIYAIGDCAQFKTPSKRRKSIEQLWYTGRMHGETVASTICGNKKAYQAGHWFNSAKFLDIEYQTYGWVMNELQAGEDQFYWEEKGGKIGLKMVFDKESRKFIGLNVFGIRLRHELFNKWLNEERTIDYVLEHLKDTNFDPEFYKQYEEEIVQHFNYEKGGRVVLKERSWKRIFSL